MNALIHSFVLTSLLLSAPADAGKATRIIKDIEFARVDGQSLKLDLYLPTDTSDSNLVVWIHGGGWKAGSKDACYISWLAQYGYSVASISYRFTDAATFPAQLHDCKGAVRWLRAHAEKYGYQADRIAISGASAGGHLAALMGTTGGNRRLEGSVGGNLKYSSRVQAVADYFGATDFILRSQTQPSRANEVGSVVYDLLGGAANQKVRLARQASAAYHVSDDDPPFLVFHGDLDKTVLLDQSQAIEKAYKAAGLPLTLHILAGEGHGGTRFFVGEHATNLYNFLQTHLNPEDKPGVRP